MLRISSQAASSSRSTLSRYVLPNRNATSLSHTAQLAPPPVITTLPNKIKVVTESTPGHFHAVGVYVDAGSRYETSRQSGVSHLVDRLAFKSTESHTDAEMTSLIDKLGSQVSCSSSRETIMYQSTIFPSHLPLAVELLSSTILRPLLLPDELENQKAAAAYEIREIWQKPELILPEILHTVAFRDNTLGMPLLCPEEQLPALGEGEIRGFLNRWYRPERMVVAGVGMAHEELVDLVKLHFDGRTTNSSLTTGAGGKLWKGEQRTGSKSYATVSSAGEESEFERLRTARAVYTGGEEYIASEGDCGNYALATLQTLLGGGGSFSAGGPGKGMYTRLYTSVLNRYHKVDYCASFHHCYADSGLFGIAATVYPDFAGSIADVIAHQLHTLTGPVPGGIDKREFARAKNMLKSTLVMALESRMTAVEDLGRQTQIHGHKVPVEEMCDKIDSLTMDDLWRTANRVLHPSSGLSTLNYGLGSGRATVVAQGPNVEGLGDVGGVLRKWGLGMH
ncbi:hypothetical protein TREMEDRAFT_40551 [Tremella mesenterica DSM 1558]|uniref:uncharacterized protein n=1 Tax=Tremella mesenterica (strain ATCC 24925 / CBS 8224 / DSM 1558 / NBRC 9311 / NRRL Y-6157 / RJB 2259-6 / UBC 559-6) TaxID=578456 RepID=UPI0003F4906E|nr:uncharacterized protein TREMEDRAFT_40551 [Tremella mesenterica DSM 1558]EIW67445.1 hypothetical protein TREMEDRAFT_40551 [Tremella mesenterica DSM 1558]